MSDTPRHVEDEYAAMFSRLGGTERLRMVSDMFETARTLVIANIRANEPNISPAELRVRLFDRFYATDFDERIRAAILADLAKG
jgi:CMP-2-keto-3-deoxyoctulosonic acid synthetase